MKLTARSLWLGQFGFPSIPATGAAPQNFTGSLPMPPPIPPDGYGDKTGTWSNQADGTLYIISRKTNPATHQDCDWMGTWDEWQKGNTWNPCEPTQPVGQIRIETVAAPPPAPPPPEPPPPPPPIVPTNPPALPAPPPAQVPPQNNGQGAAAGNPPAMPTLPPPPRAYPDGSPILVRPLPPGFNPAPPAQPAAPSPAAAPEQTKSSGATTTALVAGGIGAAGILTAILVGVFRK